MNATIRALIVCLCLCVPPVLAQEAAPAPSAATFDIWEYQVEGNSLLERTQVERTVYPFLGPGRTIDSVEEARKALETLYRNKGFGTVVVNIPEQQVAQGVVRLMVVEGTVDRVRITGSRYYSLGHIRESIPGLAPGEVPHLPQVQAELETLNQKSGDRKVTPVFRAGRTPGTVEVELKVKDELPVHGELELNDRDSRDTERLRASASVRYDNLWQRGHSVSFLVNTAPIDTDDVLVFSGTYVMPVFSDTLLALYAVDSDSDVATAGDLSVVGNGQIFGARWINPLDSVGSYFHNLTLGVDYKDFEENVAPQSGVPVETPIDYVNWLIGYKGTWLTAGFKSVFGLETNFGVRGFINDEQQFDEKRFNAKPNYFYVRATLDHTHYLDHGMQLLGRLHAQLSDSPLISNEQFSAGGVDSVRGYYESQELGDKAVNASLELRSPSYASLMNEDFSEFRLLTFFDYAYLKTKDALPGQESSADLAGVGIGLQFRGAQGIRGQLYWARALATSTDVDKGSSRAHFGVSYGF